MCGWSGCLHVCVVCVHVCVCVHVSVRSCTHVCVSCVSHVCVFVMCVGVSCVWVHSACLHSEHTSRLVLGATSSALPCMLLYRLTLHAIVSPYPACCCLASPCLLLSCPTSAIVFPCHAKSCKKVIHFVLHITVTPSPTLNAL
jgi:hypothetical protein